VGRIQASYSHSAWLLQNGDQLGVNGESLLSALQVGLSELTRT
jgi:hypothetical protein